METTSSNGRNIVLWIALFGVVSLVLIFFWTRQAYDRKQEASPVDRSLVAQVNSMIGPKAQILGSFNVGADSTADYIGILPLPSPPASEGIYYVQALAIAGIVGKVMHKPGPLLLMTEAGIVNADGTPVIAQVKAPFGYRVEFKAQGLQRATLLVTILDKNAQPASDELSIGWDDTTGKFAVLGQ